MRRAAGHTLPRPALWDSGRGHRGFTLIELILVMGLLAAMMAITAPRLSGFVSGRSMVEDTRRILALTRFARSEAVARSERLQFWLKPQDGSYGVRSDSPYQDDAHAEKTYKLADKLAFKVDKKYLNDQNEATVIFWPDGTIDEDGISEFTLTEEGQPRFKIGLAANRLCYEAEDATNDNR